MSVPIEIIDDLIRSGNEKKVARRTSIYYKTDASLTSPKFYDYSTDLQKTLFEPTGRKGSMIVMKNEYIYMFGGLTSTGTYLNEFYRINIRNKIWMSIPLRGTPPSARAYHSMHLYGDKIILYGGYNASTTFIDFYVYDIFTESWAQRTIGGTAPIVSRNPSCFVYKNFFYVTGGLRVSTDRSINNTYRFDMSLVSPSWVAGVALVNPVHHHQTVVVKNEVFTFFGYTRNPGDANYPRVSVSSINPTTGVLGTFVLLPRGVLLGGGNRKEPLSRGETSAVAINDKIYFIGGKVLVTNTAIIDEMGIYDTVTRNDQSWTIFTPFLGTNQRAGSSLIVTDSQFKDLDFRIFLFGGYLSTSVFYGSIFDLFTQQKITTYQLNHIPVLALTFTLNGHEFKCGVKDGKVFITINRISGNDSLNMTSLRVYQ